MVGDMEIVLYQAAVVLGAIVGFSAVGYHLRRHRQQLTLMVVAVILPGAVLSLAPAVVGLYWAAAVTGAVVALLMARVDPTGVRPREDATAR